jgi:hypothetical protein
MPSRPVLIGRGLVTPHTEPHRTTEPPEPRQATKKPASTIQNLNQQTHPPTPEQHTGQPGETGPVHNRTTVHPVTAAIAARKHPDPSRTRKLSQPAPMVLHPTGCGRVGRRRTFFSKRGRRHGGPFWHFALRAVPCVRCHVLLNRSVSTVLARDELLRSPWRR